MYSDAERTFEVQEVKCHWISTAFGDPTCGTCEPSDLILSGETPELTPKFRNYTENDQFCNTLTVSCPRTNNDQTISMVLNQEIQNQSLMKVDESESSVNLVCMDHKWHIAKNSNFTQVKEISCQAET